MKQFFSGVPSLALQAQAGIQLDRQQESLSVATNYHYCHTTHVEPSGIPSVSRSNLCHDELGRTICNEPCRLRIHRSDDEGSAKNSQGIERKLKKQIINKQE